MYTINPQEWKKDLPAFAEKAKAFYAGEVDKNAYKGFSGLYGSYAQKGGDKSMIRLRMTAGRLTKKKLAFIAQAIQDYQVNMVHFTTCEAVQLHNLDCEPVCQIMEKALDAGIVTMGGGGDFPRNVMCSPLSGVEQGENFDVLPYAETAAEYLMTLIKQPKMPRKLKVCFSNSPENVPHATFRDLGFVSRPDGKFDVYSAGGLGNNPKFGVKMAEAVEPSKILYYILAMYQTFCAYGNYENRGKARTRYMQEICGSPEEYKKAYLEKLEAIMASGENLDIEVAVPEVTKKGESCDVSAYKNIIAQKQAGLYAVKWHPIGGMPKPESIIKMNDKIQGIEAAELRLSGDETCYIINLTGPEAVEMQAFIDSLDDNASTLFETSVSCIGASICQVGVRDSQALLAACVAAVKEAGIPDGALPQMHISGCPSSCGTHQIGKLGFRGGVKKADDGMKNAFVFYVGGCDYQSKEKMGEEYGSMFETDIPKFLVELGQTVAASGLGYDAWFEANPEGIRAIAAKYI